MKRCVVVCVGVFILAVLAAAPVMAAVNFDLGIKAGVTMSNVRWSDDDGEETALIRPTFGAFALIRVNPTLEIQPEIDFMTVGEQWSFSDEGGSGKYTEVYNYIHIPVLIKARLAKQGKIVPVVFAGPAVGILLSAKDRAYIDGDLVFTYDMKQDLKSTDFGVDLGAQAEMMLSDLKLIIDLRYYLGLTNVYAADSKFTLKNNSVMLTAGVAF